MPLGRTPIRFAIFSVKPARGQDCNTLVQVAYDRKLDAEAFKAWSQNLGHESCLTTFSSYGAVPPTRQAEIMRRLAVDDTPSDVSLQAEMLRKVADQMQRRESYWPSQVKDRPSWRGARARTLTTSRFPDVPLQSANEGRRADHVRMHDDP
jgi:hypothetical protein